MSGGGFHSGGDSDGTLKSLGMLAVSDGCSTVAVRDRRKFETLLLLLIFGEKV